jgi:hypothetical protein
MNNGGSNGEPMADYRAHDPVWLKAFIKRAHELNMRVLLYIRGIENYAAYQNFFETYLIKNRDGLYIDWALPFAMGFAKATSKHFSVYNYFMFIRSLRKTVGEYGMLIDHAILQTASSYAIFDAAITGEFSVLHSGLLESPLISTSYAGMSCTGIHLIAGNSPDRAIFSGQKAAGFAAGLGWANHPFLDPDKDFASCAAFTKPLWDIITSLSSDPIKMFNPSTEPISFAKCTNEALYPIAYKDKFGNVVVIVANLSDKSISDKVEINMSVLGIKSGSLQVLNIPGTHAVMVKKNIILINSMSPYFFCGIFINGQKAK